MREVERMSNDLMVYFDGDGVARAYDDTYDITIHCESEEEMQRAIEVINSRKWIPCSERLPEHSGIYLVTLTVAVEKYVVVRWYSQRGGWISDEHPEAWMPLPDPYKGEEYE